MNFYGIEKTVQNRINKCGSLEGVNVFISLSYSSKNICLHNGLSTIQSLETVAYVNTCQIKLTDN